MSTNNTNISISRRRARSRSAPASDRPTKRQKTTHDVSALYNQGLESFLKTPTILSSAMGAMVDIGSRLLQQLQAQLLQPNTTAIKKAKRASAPKTSNNNKERKMNDKPSIVIDLDEEATDEVQVVKSKRSRAAAADEDDFARPTLGRSGTTKNKDKAAQDKPGMNRTNSRMKSAIIEDNRMVVDEDEDTEQNYSQLSNSAGLLLLHSSQKSNKNNNNNNTNANATNKSRKNRKELSSDNYPSDMELSSQDKRSKNDFRNSTSSIFVLHPQMENQLKEAEAVFGDKLVKIDTSIKGAFPWNKFNPRYGNGGITIPFLGGAQSMSVQGIYEGMKVTADAGIDTSKFKEQSGKNLQRKGEVLGWQKGHNEEVLFSEQDALWYYYILPYKQLLSEVLNHEVSTLQNLLKEKKKLVILDAERNFDIENLRKPLSSGYLLKCYLEGNYPSRSDINLEDLYK